MKINWKKVLEYIKIIGETITAVAPVIKMILVASATLGIAMFVNDVKQKSTADSYAEAIKTHKKETEVAMALVGQYKKEVENLQHLSNSIKLENTLLMETITDTKKSTQVNKQKAGQLVTILRDSSKTQEDSIKTLVEIVPLKDSIIAEQDVVIAKQDTVIHNLNSIIENKDSQIEKLQISLTTMEGVIKTIPVYNACEQKFFFCKINKPSRKTSMITGFGIGILTAGILLR